MTSHKRTYTLTPKGERWLSNAKLLTALFGFWIAGLVAFLTS